MSARCTIPPQDDLLISLALHDVPSYLDAPPPPAVGSPSGPTRQEEYCFLDHLMIAGATR